MISAKKRRSTGPQCLLKKCSPEKRLFSVFTVSLSIRLYKFEVPCSSEIVNDTLTKRYFQKHPRKT